MPEIPGPVMKRLRHLALGGEVFTTWNPPRSATAKRASQLLGVGMRTVQRWERWGARAIEGYAYVGLGYRTGGAERAQLVLEELARLDGIEGVRVAAKRMSSRG